ncbi:MAG: DUF4905 domain-containing protein, partial [Cyclobacteriaceae bacterium]
FSFSFTGKIWNLLTDHDARYLFLELRDEEAHQVSFAACLLSEQRLLWQDLTFSEPWWLGLSAADADVLIFHEFEDTQTPEKKSYFALDVLQQEVCWKSQHLQVIDIRYPWVYGFESVGDETHFRKVSLHGDAEKYLSHKEAHLELRKFSTENKYIRHPFHYTEEDAYFETVSGFILHFLNLNPLKGCEYLEYEGKIFISYYIAEDKALANYLLVLDQEGKPLLHEKMDDQLSQVGLDTFFIAHHHVLFVRHKRELLSYAI